MTDFRGASTALVGALDVAVPAALLVAGRAIARDAAAHAPVLQKATNFRVPGSLRNAISAHPVIGKPGNFKVAVGIDESVAFYGRFQELGFHTRPAGRGQSAARTDAGSVRFIPGLHFMTRAFDANKAAAIGLVSLQVKAALDKANK